MMIDEIMADAITIAIFMFISGYIISKNKRHPLSWTILEMSLGITIVGVADIISLLYIEDKFIDCITFKFIAVGSLLAVLGLLHSVSIFPQKKFSHKLLPSIYLISAILIIFILVTSHFIACDSLVGGKRCELWLIFIVFFYSIFILTMILILLSLRSKIKLERTQAAYLVVGVLVSLLYVGVAQILPEFHSAFGYFSAVHALPVLGIFMMISVLRYHMFVCPVGEEGKDGRVDIELKPGEINAVINEHAAFLAFRKMVMKEPGMIITVKPPNLLRDRYLLEKTPIVWLTYFPSGYKNAVIPDRLHFEVMYSIINFVQKGGRIILVQGVEYLIDEFGRKYFVEFVEDIRALHSNITLILAVNDRKIVEGLADNIVEKRIDIQNPRVIVVKNWENICTHNLLVISTKEEEKIKKICHNENLDLIRVWKNFDPDRLVFEGIKEIEDKNKENVFVESMDYIISWVGEQKTHKFLKDVVDVAVHNGGMVYLNYTPRIIDSPTLMSIVEYAYE